MDTTIITIPRIIPADKAISILRVYKPDQFIANINTLLEGFITSIKGIDHAKTVFDITKYCAGYTLREIMELIKTLIKEYKANGYSIKYSVVYYKTDYWENKALYLKIKSIRFKTSKLAMSDTPPTYKEAVKGRAGFIKRFACGLI